MWYCLSHALVALYPDTSWAVVGDNLDILDWRDEKVSKPDIAILKAWIDAKHAEEPMRLLRIERNKRLDECRWVVEKYFSRGEQLPEEWRIYMQTLRDLPENANPKLDIKGNLDMTSVQFPEIPSATQ